MCKVDKHSKPVHLMNDRTAKVVDPMIFGIVGRTVGEFIVLEMGERHVARSELVELAERSEAAANLMSSFNPDQRRDSASLVDAHDIVRGAGEREITRISLDHPFDDVDLLDRLADRSVSGDFRGNID